MTANADPTVPGVCAIHQPNLFPRLSTLAKLFTADTWIILDNVQFTRRDYQHRCRLATPDDPQHQQWLTLPVHLPHGDVPSVSRLVTTAFSASYACSGVASGMNVCHGTALSASATASVRTAPSFA